MAARTADSIVVGGGIIGMTIARALARRGQRVVLIEKGALGQESSKAAAGLLLPFPHERTPLSAALLALGVDSLRRYKKFVREVSEENHAGIYLGTHGVLFTAFSSEEAAVFKGWRKALPLASQWMTGAQLRKIEPALSPGLKTGMLVKAFANVHSQDLVALLALELSGFNRLVKTREFTHVRRVEHNATHAAVITDDGRLTAEQVIIAAGAWSTRIDGVGELLPAITPVRGQIIKVLTPEKGLLKHSVIGDHFYLAPRGREILIGSTMEDAGFEKKVTVGAAAGLLAKAVGMVPAIADCGVLDSWAGLRPLSADGYPIIGRVADRIIAATGHFRDGILLAPSTAAFIADIVCENRVHPLVRPFGIERFRRA
jgi:glycine oxidase